MMRFRFAAAFALGLCGVAASASGAAASPYAPTEAEQRAACFGDALRLCAQYIPDRTRIRACLGADRAMLSEGCRAVYDASVAAEARALRQR
jgi:hypothetical protein